MEDASLDDFVDGASDGEREDGADADDDPDEGGGDEQDDRPPAVSTYDFSPDGADCAACGDSVVRRWRDDGDLVCAGCKRWG